jgi:hypothetical protein
MLRTRRALWVLLPLLLIVLAGTATAVTTVHTTAAISSATAGTMRAAAAPVSNRHASSGASAPLAAAPSPQPSAPASEPPIPTILPTVTTCPPGTSGPMCGLLPTGNPTAPPGAPVSGSSAPTSTAPCTGEGCIPQPGAGTSPTGSGPSNESGDSGNSSDCSWDPSTWGDCVIDGITSFFTGVVSDALNPLLKLLSNTLLTTPSLSSIPEVGQLWDTSWQLMIACYGMLILIAGIIVMAYETVQSRHSIKEIGPRLVAGFLAGSLSLWVAKEGIELANALAQGVIGNGLDASTAGTTLANMLMGSPEGTGIFIVLMLIALVGMLIVLLVTYIVRVALTILLIAGAPLALMAHALPQTEGIAYWWWKAYAAVLSIQIGQSFVLIMALKILLAPGGFTLFGLTGSGLVNVLVALALMYILIKIPFWVMGSIRGGGGRRGLIGTAIRSVLAYKTMGLLGGALGGGGKRRPSRRSSGGTPNPYAHARTTSSGQYLLPLPGLQRGKPKPPPHQRYPARGGRTVGPRRAPQGVQLSLPLGDDWPENKPVLGSDGQYRLPLDVHRVQPARPTTPNGPAPTGGQPRGRGHGGARGRQLAFQFDPYHGTRATSSGQYALPLGVTRTPRSAGPPPAPQPSPPPVMPPARGVSRAQGKQMQLPFDPYQGNRPNRGGQYPLPLDGLHRVPSTAKRSTPPPTSARTPAPGTGTDPAAGGARKRPVARQQQLPLQPRPRRKRP